jgi:hypothetical protein
VVPILEEDNWVNGTVYNSETEFEWYVPKRYYALESISVHSDFNKISGFEVTFNPHSDFAGCEPYT